MPKQRLGDGAREQLSVKVRVPTLLRVKRKAISENMTLAKCVDWLLSDALTQLAREAKNERAIEAE